MIAATLPAGNYVVNAHVRVISPCFAEEPVSGRCNLGGDSARASAPNDLEWSGDDLP